MHPAQQHGRRIPPPSFESAFFIRIFLVSSFLPDVTQHIHSLRASGVMSSHTACAAGLETRALRRSAGSVCTMPVFFPFSVIQSYYQILYVKMQIMYIRVNATPNAKKEIVTRISVERYNISVREPAERNLANRRIRELLARDLSIPENAVRLISGHRSPHKIFSIHTNT